MAARQFHGQVGSAQVRIPQPTHGSRTRHHGRSRGIGFLNRELADFFDGRTDNLEASFGGALFYLYRVNDALPPAGGKPLEGVPVGSITVLAASGHVLAPLVVLPPYEAGDFSRWFAAL
ncbi:hypothetical protein GCM10011575_09610 [Microlunatus endophyticus]|uniref:Uncharacterized protein n=1 Tax=Microlunatus endophyticus TaxID=1716077 RepID=A0A917S4S7_9ACTN|nr:hypothetical protein GCM10011575_09610 [Microlunatus endophyticus]